MSDQADTYCNMLQLSEERKHKFGNETIDGILQNKHLFCSVSTKPSSIQMEAQSVSTGISFERIFEQHFMWKIFNIGY